MQSPQKRPRTETDWSALRPSHDADLLQSGLPPVATRVKASDWGDDNDDIIPKPYWFSKEDDITVFTIHVDKEGGRRFLPPGTISYEAAYNILNGRWPPERADCCPDCAADVFSFCNGSTDYQGAEVYGGVECDEFELDSANALYALRQDYDELEKLTRDLVGYTRLNHPKLLHPNDTISALRQQVNLLESVVDSLKR
jgi:hypothetical protein